MFDAVAPAREPTRGSQHRLSLKEGGMLKVQGGDGIRVMALEGKLWIIQDADVRDYELEAGQSLCLGREGATLIQAMTASRLALQLPGSRQAAVAGRVSVVGIG